MPAPGERITPKDDFYSRCGSIIFDSRSLNTKENPLDPYLLPISDKVQSIIDQLRADNNAIMSPLINIHDSGWGQNWSWIKYTPVLAQTNVCISINQEEKDLVMAQVKTHIDDKRIEDDSLSWERELIAGIWQYNDLIKSGEKNEQFMKSIRVGINESWYDLEDRVMIMDKVRSNLKKKLS